MSGRYPFVHLHALSAYSFPDGACRIEDFVRRAAEIGQPACAITDDRTLHAVVPFYHEARRVGVKPILGCRLTVHDPIEPALAGALVLLAENYVGYRNLLRLSTAAHLQPSHPAEAAVALQSLAECHVGLIALSGGEHGALTRLLRAGQIHEAERVAEQLTGLFGRDAFFIELQHQDLPGQPEINERLRAIARRVRIDTVATHEIRYIRPPDAEFQRILRRLRLGGPEASVPAVSEAEPRGAFHMADTDEMARRFAEDEPSRRRAGEIAARCVVELPFLKESIFPRFPLPPEYVRHDEGRAQSEFRLLRDLAFAGLERRLVGTDEMTRKTARDRLSYELNVIRRSGFVNYFLVVADFVRYAREQGILVGPGRGSGAGSLTAYVLGITEIDPLRYSLSFERFLNPERVSSPDFDIDFCPRRRAEVIAYVRSRYGEDRVAQVITFGTFAPRAAFRDAARALGLSATAADRWAQQVPEDGRVSLAALWRFRRDLHRLADEDPAARRVFALARALEGLPRNTSTHAAGVVMSAVPLVELTPLQRDHEGHVVTQFDMKALADIGLMKMDFLGLRTLGVMEDAAEQIGAGSGTRPDWGAVPLDDPVTLDLLNRADTVGVFQLESAGMRDVLRRLGISRFSDLIAAIALYRPATMAVLDDYIARKHGRAPVVFDHPALRKPLADTQGILLYQEQVQEIAQELAGFTPAQGDRLRHVIANKDTDEMSALCAAFIEGCRRRRRLPEDQSRALFERIRRFAGYGFNKAHSVAYALLAFRTAWLKAHYPAEFFCALLSSEEADAERRAELIADAERHGIEILEPDLNRSGVHFTLENGRIRCGLGGIKFVGEEVARALVAEREVNGPFRGLTDLCVRMTPERLPRRALESLVRAGALDFTGLSRRRMFDGIPLALAFATRHRAESPPTQTLLPGIGDATVPDDDRLLPPAAPWPEHERMAAERELIGFHRSGHLLTAHEWMFSLLGFHPAPTAAMAGRCVRCAGVATEVGGGPAFRLQTAECEIEVFLDDDVHTRTEAVLREGAAIWTEGRVIAQADRVQLLAENLGPLDRAPSTLVRKILLRIPPAREDAEEMNRLRNVLLKHAGATPVELHVRLPSGECIRVHAGAEYSVTISKTFMQDIEAVLGPDSVFAEVSPCAR